MEKFPLHWTQMFREQKLGARAIKCSIPSKATETYYWADFQRPFRPATVWGSVFIGTPCRCVSVTAVAYGNAHYYHFMFWPPPTQCLLVNHVTLFKLYAHCTMETVILWNWKTFVWNGSVQHSMCSLVLQRYWNLQPFNILTYKACVVVYKYFRPFHCWIMVLFVEIK